MIILINFANVSPQKNSGIVHCAPPPQPGWVHPSPNHHASFFLEFTLP